MSPWAGDVEPMTIPDGKYDVPMAVPCHVPVVIVPTVVSDDVMTFVASVAPVIFAAVTCAT